MNQIYIAVCSVVVVVVVRSAAGNVHSVNTNCFQAGTDYRYGYRLSGMRSRCNLQNICL